MSNTIYCEYPTQDGSPCKRPVSNEGHCYLHREDGGVPDGHGAPKRNLNAAKHMVYVEREKMFERINPFEQLTILIFYEDLITQSTLNFQCEYRTHMLDCRDIDIDLPTDELGFAFLDVSYPTEYETQANFLWHAAVDLVKMLKADAALIANGLEGKKTSNSVYDRANDEWITLEEGREHHLCLEFDRMIRRLSTQLENGGVLLP